MYTVKFPACNINTLGAFRRSFCIISCDVSFGIIHRWCILVCTGNQVLSSCTRFNFPNWWLRCTLTHALSWGIVFQRARCGHWSFSCTLHVLSGEMIECVCVCVCVFARWLLHKMETLEMWACVCMSAHWMCEVGIICRRMCRDHMYGYVLQRVIFVCMHA